MPESILSQPVVDVEGNVYATIQIGAQTWLAENLRSRTFNNGDPILTTDPVTRDLRPADHESLIRSRDFESTVSDAEMPVYQWAYDGDEHYVDHYGRLYTWHAANDPRGLCPPGWRIPTQQDWNALFTFLGGKGKAGPALKATGSESWLGPDDAATNASGFTARPAGKREKDGSFAHLGRFCAWWSSNSGFYFHLEHDDPYVYRSYYYRSLYHGFSVRCLKETPAD